MRVILDTNVVISRYFSPQGMPAKILNLWKRGAFHLLVSAPILEEYERVFHYPHIKSKLALRDEEIAEIVEEFAELAEVVTPHKTLHVVTADPDDDKFIECAVEGKADYIVSGNDHLLDIKEYKGTQIVTPAQFSATLDEELYKKAA